MSMSMIKFMMIDDEYDEDDIEVTFMKIIYCGSSYINKQWLRGFE